MTIHVGAYEAKTHLPRLLEQVERGERIVITKHGIPVAIMESVLRSDLVPVQSAIEQMKAFRRGRRLGGLALREMIEEGRM